MVDRSEGNNHHGRRLLRNRARAKDDLLDGLDAAEREELEPQLTSIWERSGGYEAWSQVAAEADEKAA